jgi:hypothetical protein
MKINGIEIILDGALPTDELVGYVERAKENYGDRIVQMSVKVDGEFVELDYTIQPIRFERIRRITGYLVGTTDRWNNAKRAEEHDRVKHGLANQCVACGAEMPEGDHVCRLCREGAKNG